MIDTETNPLYFAAIGGIILGIATSLHYMLKGNVTGISSIINDVIFFNRVQMPNKLIIIGGIIIASGIFFDIFGYGTYNGFTPFGSKDEISKSTSYPGYALAGLLVGFGTKLSNGCTSGHGLCGMPRLSIRSFVAVAIFLTSAIGISTLRLYLTLGPFSQVYSFNFCQFVYIISFLEMGPQWNPSLLFVLGCGVCLNLVVFNYMIRIKKVPFFCDKLFNPDFTLIDWKLVIGSLCFGLGWGIGGVCPGPVLALLPVFQVQIHVIWFTALIMGTYIATKLENYAIQKQSKSSQQDADFTDSVKISTSTIVPVTSKRKANTNTRKDFITIQKCNEQSIVEVSKSNSELSLNQRSFVLGQ